MSDPPSFGPPEVTPDVTGNFNNISIDEVRDGETSNPEGFNDALYSPRIDFHGLSFEGINGLINPAVGELSQLNHRHVQRGSFCAGNMVGLTGNLNYQAERFFGRTNDKTNWRLVPGACIEFYLPKDSQVILTWQIGGACAGKFKDPNDEYKEHGLAQMGLFIDDYLEQDPEKSGYSKPTGSREIPRSVHSATDTATDGIQSNRVQRPHRDRVWSGHYFVDLDAGWHSAGIGVWQNWTALKLRTRNMKVIWFPKPTS